MQCDETKPQCKRCEKIGRVCQYPSVNIRFRDASGWAEWKVKKGKGDALDSDKVQPSTIPPAPPVIAPEPMVWVPEAETRAEMRVDLPLHLAGASAARHTDGARPYSDINIIEPYPSGLGAASCGPMSCGPASGGSGWMSDYSTEKELGDYFFEPLDMGYDVQTGCLIYGQSPSIPGDVQRVITGSVYSGETGSSPSSSETDSFDAFDIVSSRKYRRHSNGEVQVLSHTSPNFLDYGWTNASQWQLSKNASVPLALLDSQLTAKDRSYLKHFNSHVVQILPLKPDALRHYAKGAEVVLYAAMALGAANLANFQGSFSKTPEAPGRWKWHHDQVHKVNALQYTGKALSLAKSEALGELGDLMAASLLLSYVETQVGTFAGLRQYICGIEDLTVKTHAQIHGCDHGNGLLTGAVNTRVMGKYLTGPWRLDEPSEGGDPFWTELELWSVSQSVLVQKIGSEAFIFSIHVTLLAVKRHCMHTPDTVLEALLERTSTWLGVPGLRDDATDQEVAATQEELYAKIEELSKRLQECKPPKGLPMDDPSASSQPPSALSEAASQDLPFDLEPLYFDTHEEAMDIADYALSQILCETALLRQLIDPDSPSPTASFAQSKRWMEIVLRVAMGLDITECVNRNVYRRGICAMLYQCSILFSDPRILLFLDSLLEKMAAAGRGWEDANFPTIMIRPFLKLIRQQLEQGRTIVFWWPSRLEFSAAMPVYSGHGFFGVTIFGREADGRTFTYVAPDIGTQRS